MMETMPMVEDFGFLDMLLKPADQNTPEDRYGTVDGKNPAPIFLGIKKRFRASEFFPSTVLYLYIILQSNQRPSPIIPSPVGLGSRKN